MTAPILEAADLSYRYPDGRVALRGLSFQMARGETVGLVGPNGAGKSTLLLHLNGVLPERWAKGAKEPSANGAPTVVVAGKPVVAENMAFVRRTVGLLFQDPDDQLFCPTVLEDVAFGPLNHGEEPPAARATAAQSLAAVGLAGFEDRVPHHLSFGEKKRVCLAGVLACRPELLALDEPTSNLDPRGRRQFIDLLAGLDAAKLIATHDLELVLELCDRVLVLDEGRLVAEGPTQDLLANAELMAAHGLETPLSLRIGPTRIAANSGNEYSRPAGG